MVYLFNIISFIILVFLIFNFELQSARDITISQGVHMPDIFLLSTMILFCSLFITSWQRSLLKSERVVTIKQSFYLELLLNTTFIILQMVAVYRFQYVQVNHFSESFNSYFILLTSFHLTHLILHVIVLIMLMFRIVNVLDDPVKVLIYITNPFEKLLLDIKQIVNNYQVFIWVVVYLYTTFRF